jgi:hypothetical protein
VNPNTDPTSNLLSIPIRRVRGETDADLPLPQYMSDRAAGMDIFAAVESDLTIQSQEAALVPTSRGRCERGVDWLYSTVWQ